MLRLLIWRRMPSDSALAEMPWQDVARHLYPVSAAMASANWYILLAIGIWYGIGDQTGALAPVQVPLLATVAGVSVAYTYGWIALGQRVPGGRVLGWGDWRAHRRFMLVQGNLVQHVLLAVLYAQWWEPSVGAWGLVAVAALLIAVIAHDGRLRVARLFGLAWDARDPLRSAVARLSDRLGVARPPVTVYCSMQAEASANLLAKSLLFTTSMLRILDDEELEAVAAHELGHLTHSRRSAVGGVIRCYFWLAACASPLLAATVGWFWAVVIVGSIFPIGGRLAREGREEERIADDAVATLGVSDAAWRSALLKMYEDGLIPENLAAEEAPHPPLAERVGGGEERDSVTETGSRRAWMVALTGSAVLWLSLVGVSGDAALALLSPELGARARLSVDGGAAGIAAWASHFADEGKWRQATTLAARARRLDPNAPEPYVVRARVCNALGMDEGAALARHAAEERAWRSWRWLVQFALGGDPVEPARRSAAR